MSGDLSCANIFSSCHCNYFDSNNVVCIRGKGLRNGGVMMETNHVIRCNDERKKGFNHKLGRLQFNGF